MRIAVTLSVLALIANASVCHAVDLVLIKGSSFLMGSPATEIRRGKDEVQHSVSLQDFYIGKYEITQKEYREVMNANPSDFKGDNLPVESVTWYDAVRYSNAQSKSEGLTPAYVISESGARLSVTWNRNANGYRLPTEAEWEYASRAGTLTPFNTGDNIAPSQANYYGHYPYNDAPAGEYRQRTVPVGSFSPNSFGLYDMHGNVWEWCWDWYGEYTSGRQESPDGASSGVYRVNRGGGWNDFGRHLRSAYRAAHPPVNKTFNLGFRIARNAQ